MGLHPDYRKDPYERKRKNIAALLMNYACIKLIDASVLLYFSFDSSFSQSRSMRQAVPTVTVNGLIAFLLRLLDKLQ